LLFPFVESDILDIDVRLFSIPFRDLPQRYGTLLDELEFRDAHVNIYNGRSLEQAIKFMCPQSSFVIGTIGSRSGSVILPESFQSILNHNWYTFHIFDPDPLVCFAASFT
jgi:hypothetical protein